MRKLLRPGRDVRTVELFGRWLEETGRMRSTVARRLSTLASFYRYCEQELLVDRNPAVNVRRPKVDFESRTDPYAADRISPVVRSSRYRAAVMKEWRRPTAFGPEEDGWGSLDRHATYIVATFLAGAYR